jgi:transposase InsO family protein
MNGLTPEKEKIIEDAYKNPRYGLSSAPKLYQYLKQNKLTYGYSDKGITIKNIRDYLSKQEVYQVLLGRHNNYNSFVAEAPLIQFQIDLIYMPKAWHNKGYEYILSCVDVFSKKGEMIPMKKRDSKTTAEAIKLLFKKMGVPKTIYSDQGTEFNNKDVLKILEGNNVKIIFALDHAPFVESFNKTMKNKLYKYMAYHDTANWSDVLDILVDAYNNTPHSSTKIAPNKINQTNQLQARMNMLNRAKVKNYEPLEVGDVVRVPIINKVEKGYKQQWSYELHKIQRNNHDGTYTVNGEYYPRKELQKVKDVVKLPEKPKEEKEKIKFADKVGIAEKNKDVKNLRTSQNNFNVETLLTQSARPKRNKYDHEKMNEVFKILRRR